MSINSNENHDAQDILTALTEIQDSAELQAEAQSNPESLLNRLKLSGVARHAVAFAITAMFVAPAVSKHIVNPTSWW